MSAAVLSMIIVAAVLTLRRPRARRATANLLRLAGCEARVHLGTYTLADLMTRMVDAALGSALPSVTKTYLPQRFVFQLACTDYEAWNQLLPAIGQELSDLIGARAAELGYDVVEGGIGVRLCADDGGTPGRPIMSSARRIGRATTTAALAAVGSGN